MLPNSMQQDSMDEQELRHIIRGIVHDFSPRVMTLHQADMQTDAIVHQILQGRIVAFVQQASPNN